MNDFIAKISISLFFICTSWAPYQQISQRTIFLAVLLEIPLFMVLLYGSCIFYIDQEFDISHHCVL